MEVLIHAGFVKSGARGSIEPAASKRLASHTGRDRGLGFTIHFGKSSPFLGGTHGSVHRFIESYRSGTALIVDLVAPHKPNATCIIVK